MKINLNQICAILVASSLVILSGCSKSTETSQNESQDNPAEQVDAIFTALNSGKTSVDQNAPLDKYVQVSNPFNTKTIEGNTEYWNAGSDYVFVYYALCKCETDYDELAQNVSLNYALTTDVFKKKELLEKLKPGIDSKLAKFKETRLVKMLEQPYFDAYDFTKKEFKFSFNSEPVTDILANTALEISKNERERDRSVGDKELVAHYLTIDSINVPDETIARRIEAVRNGGSRGDLQLIIYAYVQSVGIENGRRCFGNMCSDGPRRGINLQVVKYSLVDNKGNTLVGPITSNSI